MRLAAKRAYEVTSGTYLYGSTPSSMTRVVSDKEIELAFIRAKRRYWDHVLPTLLQLP